MMAMSPATTTTFLPNRPLSAFPPTQCQSPSKNSARIGNFQKPISFTVRAAKLPPGVGFRTHFCLFSIFIAVGDEIEMGPMFSGRNAESGAQAHSSHPWIHTNCRDMECQSLYDRPCWDFYCRTGESFTLKSMIFHSSSAPSLREIQTVWSSSPAVSIDWNASDHMRKKGIWLRHPSAILFSDYSFFLTFPFFLQIFHRGILQIIGIDVGKGLDLPL